MGQWFAKYFAIHDSQVGIFSRRAKSDSLEKQLIARKFSDINDCIENSDVIMVSVPIGRTAEVVSEVSKSCNKDKIIIEIASLKESIFPSLRQVCDERGIMVLSIHPLFGPGANPMQQQRYAMIPVVSEADEMQVFEEIFPDGMPTVITAEKHDLAMGYVLSLTHFVSIAFLLSIPEKEGLMKLSGTTFKLQLGLAQAILHDEPELLAMLETDNNHFIDILETFTEKSNMIQSLVKRKDRVLLTKIITSLKEELKDDESFESSYPLIYQILDKRDE